MLKEPKERVREASPEEETAFFAALAEDYADVVELALLTGFRKRECLLRWSQIDWGNSQIKVHGKGDKWAVIPMTESVRALLWRRQNHHAEFVFTYLGDDGERHRITTSGLTSAWRRAVIAAKIDDLRFHDLRHTFASRAGRACGDLAVLQELMRHEDIETTMKYRHVVKPELRKALEAMEEARTMQRPAAAPLQQVG
jgi:integrase